MAGDEGASRGDLRDGLGIGRGGEPEQIRFAGAHTGLLYPCCQPPSGFTQAGC